MTQPTPITPSSYRNKNQKQKTRFDGLDVAAMTAHIHRTLLGHKLANVYDGAALSTSSTDVGGGVFLFKLANPNASNNNTATATDASAEVGVTTTTLPPSTTTTTANRTMLLMESGVRFHTTSYYSSGESSTTNNNSNPPSQFAMKLRKHLRNLRLENVKQLGNLDRVVDFRFGSGAYAHHIILELYGMGNLILTNGRYEILALLRLHEYGGGGSVTAADGKNKKGTASKGEEKGGRKTGTDDEDQGGEVKVRVGNIYPVTYATTMSSTSNPILVDGVVQEPQSLLEMDQDEAYQWIKKELMVLKEKADAGKEENKQHIQQLKKKQGKKNKQNGSTTLKTFLLKPSSGVFHYGPSLLEHCILSAGLDPSLKFALETLDSVLPTDTWGTLLQKLKEEGSNILQNFHLGDTKGYILYHQKPTETTTTNTDTTTNTETTSSSVPHADKIFLEFQPHLLQQHTSLPTLTYPSFFSAVDTYFSLLSFQKRAVRAETAETTALARLEKIRTDQSRRMDDLRLDMATLREHAEIVEAHADDVDKALGVVNGAVECGMDWEGLAELVRVEKAAGNPIASLVGELDLEKGEVVLELPDTRVWDGDEGGSGGDPPVVNITVSIHESAHGNARTMYDRYRTSKEKVAKTMQASEKALTAAEAAAKKQVEAARRNKSASYAVMSQPQRRQHWFEKFHWFVTSDNYLVLGGRDAQQNEILVKRYLRPGDAYLHADAHGAPSCVLRAKRRRRKAATASGAKGGTEVLTLSEQALREAGNFAICRSSAWASRMVTSAWWVDSHQVSKTAPTGEYLTVGSFMIRGKKNFLPASQLEMGLGVMFRLGDEASVARHANERRDFTLMALEENGNVVGSGDQDMVEKRRGKSDVRQKKDPSFIIESDTDTKQVVDEKGWNEAEMDWFVKANSVNEEPSTIPEGNDTKSYSDVDEEKKDLSEPEPESNMSEDVPGKEIKHATADKVDDTDQTATLDVAEAKKKRGFSARDRKLIKKYGSLEAAEKLLEQLKIENEKKQKNVTNKLVSMDENTQKQPEKKAKQSNLRGRKSKMKKISKKYADQDDEDRELAIMALQGGGKLTKKEKKKKKGGRPGVNPDSVNQLKAAADTTTLLIRNAEEVVNEKLSEEVRAILAECVTVTASEVGTGDESKTIRWDKLDAEVLEDLVKLDSIEAQVAAAKRLLSLIRSTRVDNFSASLAGIIRTVHKYGFEGIQPMSNELAGTDGKQRKSRANKAAEKEAWREILAEDGIIEDDGNNDAGPVDDSAEIDKLTGKPQQNDLVLYALPVCAPYHTLRNYMYRVKLTPGSQRRGKASKQCIEMFNQTDARSVDRMAMTRYLELIKGVNVNDWAQIICGDVKISAAGASKVMNKQKSGAKKSKKK